MPQISGYHIRGPNVYENYYLYKGWFEGYDYLLFKKFI